MRPAVVVRETFDAGRAYDDQNVRPLQTATAAAGL